MNYTVIVMEYDQISSDELVAILKRAGIEAVVAGKPEEYKGILPDAVVIDERAGTGGWELSSRIRDDSNVPIMMLGDSESELAWVKAVAHGVDYYLPRPFSPRELVARLGALMRRYNGAFQSFNRMKYHKIRS